MWCFHFTSCELQTIKDYLLIKMTGRLHLCYSSICYWPQILVFPKINELMDLYSKYWGLPISGYCVWRFLQLSMVKTVICGKLWNARAPLMTSVLMFQLMSFSCLMSHLSVVMCALKFLFLVGGVVLSSALLFTLFPWWGWSCITDTLSPLHCPVAPPLVVYQGLSLAGPRSFKFEMWYSSYLTQIFF